MANKSHHLLALTNQRFLDSFMVMEVHVLCQNEYEICLTALASL